MNAAAGVPGSTWRACGVALVLALVCALGAARAPAAQGPAVGCGYGTGGPFASNLCWFDMSGYGDALARSPAGQQMSVTLPGGYTVSFMLTSRPVPGAALHPGVEARAVPLEPRFAFGSAGYVGVPGRPSLYSFDAGADNGVDLTLSDISVVDSSGAPVTGYSFAIADTENNIAGESFTWTSDRPLELIGVLNEGSPRGCHNALTGLGTTRVTCTGQGGSSPPPGTPTPWYDDVIVGADTPSTIGLSMRTFARSGIAFAIMTAKIEVSKSVVGRVRGSDSFDVAAVSPEGTTIASAGTGAGSSASTGELTVLPRSGGAAFTLGEAATAGSGTLLSDYARSWSCTNNGTPDPSLPSGAGASVSVSPQAGDDIACTVTNAQLPADLSIAKSAAPLLAVPGTEETYTIAVTNHGPSRATNVRAADPLPGGLTFVSASPGCGEAGGTVTCAVDSLEAGASRTFDVTARIASSVRGCDLLRNTATVASDTPDSDATNNVAEVCPQLASQTDLSIAKTASVGELPVGGGQVMYTLVVENDGPSDATGVTVSDPLAPGLTIVSAKASQGSCTTAGGGPSCSLGTLPPGGSAQVLVTADVAGTPGTITNTATVSGAELDGDLGDNTASATVTVPAAPQPPAPPPPAPQPPAPQPPAQPFDLVVTKTANDESVSVGEPVTYAIVVANRGPAAAPAVKLTDTLTGPVRVRSVKTTAGTCSRRIPMRCALGTIPAGGKVTVRVVARHLRPRCPERNAASATAAGADAVPGNNLDAVRVCAIRIGLRLSKTADRRAVAAGGRVTYTIRVTNPSGRAVRNVRTCDHLPAALVYVSASSKPRLRGGAWCWTADRIGPGTSRRYRITVRALPGVAGVKVNRASAGGGDRVKAARAERAVEIRPTAARGGGVTG